MPAVRLPVPSHDLDAAERGFAGACSAMLEVQSGVHGDGEGRRLVVIYERSLLRHSFWLIAFTERFHLFPRMGYFIG